MDIEININHSNIHFVEIIHIIISKVYGCPSRHCDK